MLGGVLGVWETKRYKYTWKVGNLSSLQVSKLWTNQFVVVSHEDMEEKGCMNIDLTDELGDTLFEENKVKNKYTNRKGEHVGY